MSPWPVTNIKGVYMPSFADYLFQARAPQVTRESDLRPETSTDIKGDLVSSFPIQNSVEQ